MRGPAGKYRMRSSGDLVVIAGGTGITAVLEISEGAAQRGRNVVTIYSVRTVADVLLKERLVGTVHIVCTEVSAVHMDTA